MVRFHDSAHSLNEASANAYRHQSGSNPDAIQTQLNEEDAVNKNEIRNELLKEIIAGYDQLIEMYKTGGAAALSGHAYDPNEFASEIELLQQLKKTLTEMVVNDQSHLNG